MIRSVNENGEGYTFVYIPHGLAEALDLKKCKKVDVRLQSGEIRIIPI
jgi:antitoxin component of MazEF toxin-antitoxin module